MINNYNEPKIAKIIDQFHVVLNKGSDDEISLGQIFLIYRQTEEIRDPDTGDLLECLFVAKGKGKIVQIQNKISVLRSIEIEKPSSLSEAFSLLSVPNKIRPFEKPCVGDSARLLVDTMECSKCGKEISSKEAEQNNSLCDDCARNNEKLI